MDRAHASGLTLADFDFDLPPELIAQQPLPERSASRLLHVRPDGLDDLHFTDLESQLAADDVLVFNDTRVIKARLFGRKASGGKVEILIERILAPHEARGESHAESHAESIREADSAWALVRTSHAPRTGAEFMIGAGAGEVRATVLGRHEDFFHLRFDRNLADTLDRFGHVPLPPYIARADSSADEDRYQTVYAKVAGAVAAPTAGLHFDPQLLARLRARGIAMLSLTLHVGAGTFQPVRAARLHDHVMHSERYSISPAAAEAINRARAEGRRIVAVGTTTLRALESAAAATMPTTPSEATGAGSVAAGDGETRLFITPGYRFRIVDRLLTNFHLPRSTLLMLVYAFAGKERMRAAYAHAIRERYRFFSYGDASLLERA